MTDVALWLLSAPAPVAGLRLQVTPAALESFVTVAVIVTACPATTFVDAPVLNAIEIGLLPPVHPATASANATRKTPRIFDLPFISTPTFVPDSMSRVSLTLNVLHSARRNQLPLPGIAPAKPKAEKAMAVSWTDPQCGRSAVRLADACNRWQLRSRGREQR